jgi:uncharacterized protein
MTIEFVRYLDLKNDKKSVFLLGPRQTGKSFLLKQLFPNAEYYNLLHTDVFRKLSFRPELLRHELLGYKGHLPVIIDEIQKLPILLDEVQALIDEKKFQFILTGSSARKLKRGSANLLGGRARIKHLFPLTTAEIPSYDLSRILNFGALPSVYLATNPVAELKDYVGSYLKEEIQAEALVRKIENFSRFLEVAALTNGELVNFTNVASDAMVPQRTVVEYYKILEDTLVGQLLPPFQKTKKRKPIATAKFYFFDLGVANELNGRSNVRPRTELYGKALEHLIFTELRAFLSYTQGPELTFWRSQSKLEVDFVIGDMIAIEVKATENVSEKHLSGIKALSEEIKLKRKIVISHDQKRRVIQGVEVLPVPEFLKSLWNNELIP